MNTSPFTKGPISAVTLFYALGFVMVYASVGPWEAMRRFVVEGVILVLWLWVAQHWLREVPPGEVPILRPALELGLGLLGFVGLQLAAAGYFEGARWLRWVAWLMSYSVVLAVLFASRYGPRALGLANARLRAWLVLLAIVGINVVVGITAGQLLPPGEFPTPPGADLADDIRNPLDVIVVLAQVIIVAALPEELYFRVYLQPRLAHYLPVGWAMVIQALLFSAAHLPQHLIRFGYPWPLALAEALSIANGLIGGYLWWRTRSLPLLMVLHVFAYPRFGL